MCGGSKSTAAPPPSPPTTFGYADADRSNTAKRTAQVNAATQGQTSMTTMAPTDTMVAAGPKSTLGGS
jgi:hypothetical protein